MAATYTTATDEMLTAFRTAWEAGAGAYNGGSVPEVRYDGIGEEGPPDGEEPWARVAVRHATSEQATLSSGAGFKRMEKRGIIAIQVFYPLALGGGPTGNSGKLAEVAKNAFEGTETPSHVWFRNARIIAVGADGPWYQLNVLADFVYDELI
jgi:hypothetical protein